MSQIDNNTSAQNISEIMKTIDLGPTDSVQLMFAKLQLAQSELCKQQAEDYMKQIEAIQEEQKLCAKMIEEARAAQNAAKTSDECTSMSSELKAFMVERNLSYDKAGNDDYHTADEWDYNIKSLTNYQEQIGNKTQTLMVYLQDFIGQYNSYLQGANTQIANAMQVLTGIARGQ